MTRLQRIRLALLTMAVIVTAGSAAAAAALASGPPVTAPSSGPGPYYSGPVHECVNPANENGSGAYFELHSTSLGNCASGYRQVTVNELTPAFTLQLGSVAYQCTAATSQAETAISCAVPASPSPSASNTG